MLNKFFHFFNPPSVVEHYPDVEKPPVPKFYTDLEVFKVSGKACTYEVWAVDNTQASPFEDGFMVAKVESFVTLYTAQKFVEEHKGIKVI